MTLIVKTETGTVGKIDTLTDNVIGELWTVDKDSGEQVVEKISGIVDYGEDWVY